MTETQNSATFMGILFFVYALEEGRKSITTRRPLIRAVVMLFFMPETLLTSPFELNKKSKRMLIKCDIIVKSHNIIQIHYR